MNVPKNLPREIFLLMGVMFAGFAFFSVTYLLGFSGLDVSDADKAKIWVLAVLWIILSLSAFALARKKE